MEGAIFDMRQHYFVDCLQDEVKDIQSAVKELLIILKRVNNTERRIFSIEKFEMCGSMAEKTRIWSFDSQQNGLHAGGVEPKRRNAILEFDFLALLDRHFGPLRLVRETRHSCQGYMTIFKQSSNGSYNTYYEKKGVYLSPKDISERFQSELVYSVAGTCDCYDIVHVSGGLYIRRKRRRMGRGCNQCTIYRNTGHLRIASKSEFGHPYDKRCNLIFKWTSKLNTISAKDVGSTSRKFRKLGHIFVLVDVVPAFSLDDNEPMLSLIGGRRLVSKSCKICDSALCWRISYVLKEIELVSLTRESHRHAYMTLKLLVSLAFPESVYSYLTIHSYILKTSLLQHIDNCYDITAKTVDCLSNILDILSVSFDNKEIDNHFTHHNMLDRYNHLPDDFFRERSSGFRIIQHIVKLTDLIGSANCSIGVIIPYLRNAHSICKTLLNRGETLHSIMTTVEAEYKRVEEMMSSIKTLRQPKLISDEIFLPEQDMSDYRGSAGDDTATLLSEASVYEHGFSTRL